MSLQAWLDEARAAYTLHRKEVHGEIGHCTCPACGGQNRPQHQCGTCIRLIAKIDLVNRTIRRRNET